MITVTGDTQRIQHHLKAFDFKNLFVEELGWDILKEPPLSITIDAYSYTLRPLVEKRGVKAYICDPDQQGKIPADATLRKIEREVTKHAYEHILIFIDTVHENQAWQWVKRETGKPLAARYERLHKQQSGERLAQKLSRLAFSISEEEQLLTATVSGRVRSAFDVERVTKKFYDRFKVEHARFLAFIDGITAQTSREWYASLMLNRLMFVYFIQRKGFLGTTSANKLDGDTNYLSHRLHMVQEQDGQDNFHSFYRYFLLKLFHDGLSKREHAPALEALLGKIPYLNGGLFDVHELERANPDINIPDEAFEQLFAFFDEFDWHLDDRLLKQDNEINPDVLGYIFEKYINQKQMGAYYTKEDITDYIGKNTIIPYLFDAAAQKCLVAFEANGPVWSLLRDNPDRYIYDAVKKGCELPLPPHIEVGILNVAQRNEWNRPAPSEYALPTEIWREVVARRSRYAEVKAKLAAGEIQSINDLITYNLDLRQFAQDAIMYCEGTNLLRAFYESIENVTVLDPTCGSGAFLFAALNILEPLYEACLERMQIMVDERDRLDAMLTPTRRHTYSDINRFRAILAHVANHPNRYYFILKSIIINNLYGVDIMEEATEICKLRLFLKLVSQVQQLNDIEPLPDIDFNIRAGNTLVGFATYAEAEKVITSTLDFDNVMGRIEQKAKEVERSFTNFRALQTTLQIDSTEMSAMKQQIRHQLKALNAELHGYLAEQYGIDRKNKPNKEDYEKSFKHWEETHQPFHWFVEFYKIMQDGGFDVIIGNPPYVEYSKVRKEYNVKDYQTESGGNLYALVMERCISITHDHGRNGMIVQLPIVCTDRMIPMQNLLSISSSALWLSSYDDRPAKLFDGLEHIRASIVINQVAQAKPTIWTTKYHRWVSETRDTLFHSIYFMESIYWDYSGAFPKLGNSIERNVVQKLQVCVPLGKSLTGTYKIYFHNAPQYWIRAMTLAPYFWNERHGEQISTQVKSLVLPDRLGADVVAATINSSLFYWWFIVLSDCRHLNMREIERFHLGLASMKVEHKQTLAVIVQRLMVDFQKHATRKEAYYKATGKIIYDEFYPRHSKPIIDEIDRVLAKHYGFTDEELDFIINYDIKYRMGKDSANEGEE
ncbi:MAG: Eco57I restriction-modification methylase domain-containing protein [Ktedonobacteraceae bacterium]